MFQFNDAKRSFVANMTVDGNRPFARLGEVALYKLENSERERLIKLVKDHAPKSWFEYLNKYNASSWFGRDGTEKEMRKKF